MIVASERPEQATESDEVAARVISLCQGAGIVFEVRNGELTISFDRVNWLLWPEVKLALEAIGGEKLVSHLRTHSAFPLPAKATWKMTGRG
jgi:hypothetical protein